MKTTITALCRIVTPMMAAGADQQQFEIRASEVKAGLRFWWRVFQPLEGQALFRSEKELFGSTEGASPFRLSVDCRLTDTDLWKPGEVHKWGIGAQYVFFATNLPYQKRLPPQAGKPGRPELQPRLKGPKENGRAVAKPDEGPGKHRKFTLRLRIAERPDRFDPMKMGDLLCALWLLENLGGLGGRTRRGAGCFEIEELKIGERNWNSISADTSAYGPVPPFTFGQKQTAGAFIHEGIKIAQTRWGNGFSGEILDHTSFFNPGRAILVLSSSKNSAWDVLEQVGHWFKDYCHKNPLIEAQVLHGALDGTASPDPFNLSKAARGLPIIYNFSGTKGRYTATFDDGGKEGRRASPLLISCHERGGKGYAVVCHFPAQLLPTGKVLQLKLIPPGNAWKGALPSPSQDFIKEMLHKSRVEKDSHGNEIRSLCDTFGEWCDAIAPKEETIVAGRKEDRTRRPQLVDFIPKAGKLLREVQAMQTPDRFRIKKIIEELEKLQATDEKGASEVAMALKNKLVDNKDLWKKHGMDIESCILD